jgi:hypothetical protein
MQTLSGLSPAHDASGGAGQCDKLALHHGKRCILWDDEGSGFCLWLNWDWAANRPAKVHPTDERRCAHLKA